MNYAEERERMVERQLVSRDITDEDVLQAFRSVPRHRFVPERRRDRAYGDHPIPVGEGQTISQPYMVASMTELLRVDDGAKVLEVGTGSGYQAAILAELGARVISIERHSSLAEQARSLLDELGYDVTVTVGDGTRGYEDGAPYDGIIVTAAAPEIPQALQDQLKGGRLVIPVGSRVSQQLVLGTKKDGRFTTEERFGCRFVPLLGEDGW